jgi:hypothetical protein
MELKELLLFVVRRFSAVGRQETALKNATIAGLQINQV